MTMRDIADAVKRSVTAGQAAEALGLHVNRSGFCRCPVHGEKTGSMKIYPGNRGWYCFGCHTGGSVIDLVMACYGMEMPEAVRWLNDTFRLGLPVDTEATPEQQEEARRRAAERERDRAEKERAAEAQNAALERYYDLGRQIGQAELDKAEYAPQSTQDAWDPRFVEALNRMAEMRAEADDLAVQCIGKENA